MVAVLKLLVTGLLASTVAASPPPAPELTSDELSHRSSNRGTVKVTIIGNTFAGIGFALSNWQSLFPGWTTANVVAAAENTVVEDFMDWLRNEAASGNPTMQAALNYWNDAILGIGAEIIESAWLTGTVLNYAGDINLDITNNVIFLNYVKQPLLLFFTSKGLNVEWVTGSAASDATSVSARKVSKDFQTRSGLPAAGPCGWRYWKNMWTYVNNAPPTSANMAGAVRWCIPPS